MVIIGSDRYTHILIIGGPPFSFLGLLHYRLKSDVRVRDLKFTLSPENRPHPQSLLHNLPPLPCEGASPDCKNFSFVLYGNIVLSL